MPTTRRQSAGPSTPSMPASATPKPSSSRSARRSLSQTPSHSSHAHAHHHRTADEIMLAEAEQILHPSHHPDAAHGHHRSADELAAEEAHQILGDDSASMASPALRSGRLRGDGRRTSRGGELVVEIPAQKARAPRRRSWGRMSSSAVSAQSQDEEEAEDEGETSALLDLGGESDGVVILGDVLTADEDGEAEGGKVQAVEPAPNPTSESSRTAGKSNSSIGSSTTAQPSSAALLPASSQPSNRNTFANLPLTPAEAASDESDGSSSSEEDSDEADSDSSDDTSESDEEDSEDEAAEDARLEKLLAAAKLSAKGDAAQASGGGEAAIVGMGDEDMLRLDADEDVADAPIPQMIIPGLPPPSLRYSANGLAKAGPSRPTKAPTGSDKGKERAVELDNREYSRPLTKREKANQPKKATPSELWSTLPSARADLLPQMKRDYQALALANSMDPKRFMKGGNKAGKVPETFAIGTLVEPPRHLQASTMTRETKYRPGQLVQDVVADTGVGEYAKRKFGDLQSKRMENGRGKGWKKRAKWW